MDIISFAHDLQEKRQYLAEQSLSVGFVPTMGYLHEGHRSLIVKAHSMCDRVIVSIFVNPTQFGPSEDYEKYPSDIEHDIKVCEQEGVDILFMPSVEQVYPSNQRQNTISYPELTALLCGQIRPGHFDGVLQVMNRFLLLVSPDYCYMGMKDAQQLLLIQRLTRDYFPNINVVGCPTIRESDMVALSSRNTYLSEQERISARVIYRELNRVAKNLSSEKSIDELCEQAREEIKQAGLVPQYFTFVSRLDLLPAKRTQPGEYLLAAAAMCSSTRLIDNFFIDISREGIHINPGVVVDVNGDGEIS